ARRKPTAVACNPCGTGTALGVQPDHGLEIESLVGTPAVRRRSVVRPSHQGSVHTFSWIERRDRHVATESDRGPLFQDASKSVRPRAPRSPVSIDEGNIG